jgi:hypothetical protein
MNNIDPLLLFISQHASDPDERSTAYKISVVVGGEKFTGFVSHPDPFVESVLPTDDLVARYREMSDVEKDISVCLHLHVEEGPGITFQDQREVRFRLDGIDAWWAE